MEQPKSAQQQAEEFLKQAHLFHLGILPTEMSHPDTKELSDWAKGDLEKALQALHKIDVKALSALTERATDLVEFQREIQATLESGGRIFLGGCGATGRLSLSLEYLWRQRGQNSDAVVAFMAGGDVALVHSIEGFEDFPEYGAEQLRGLGFGENDLFIGITEGGETPFVIGATEAAMKISRRQPYFLFCNPAEILLKHVERSRRVLQNGGIRSISLSVGPMALAGSTRMQASTVLMLAVGVCLFGDSMESLSKFTNVYREMDLRSLADFVRAESDTYLNSDRVLYVVDRCAITVFTDTTERAPTFSLPPFNNQVIPRADHSLTYIQFRSAKSPAEAWHKLLAREPRSLEWRERNVKTTSEYLMGFDFSMGARAYRERVVPNAKHYDFEILDSAGEFHWKFRDCDLHLARTGLGELFDQLVLKMMLNAHSTLVMGRLDRYVGNFMTWVFPSNGKLIDRATRYVLLMCEREGLGGVTYEQAVREIFVQMQSLKANESIVLKTFGALNS